MCHSQYFKIFHFLLFLVLALGHVSALFAKLLFPLSVGIPAVDVVQTGFSGLQ